MRPSPHKHYSQLDSSHGTCATAIRTPCDARALVVHPLLLAPPPHSPSCFLCLRSASAVTVCCPISVVKTRIEGNSVSPYRGLFHGLATIWRTEGVRGLYTGLLPSVLKDSPYSAVYLLAYSRLKTIFIEWDQKLHVTTPATIESASQRGQHPIIQFSAAFLAGGFSTALFQPTEVIKTRLQLARLAPITAGGATGASASANILPPRHRVLWMVRTIYAEDGMRGFMRGLLPRIIKRSLSNACGWMMFEQMVQFWSGTTGL
jgi:solute carrier family 25 protein 38